MGRNVVRETAPTDRRGVAGSASDWRVAALTAQHSTGQDGSVNKSARVIADIMECGRDTSRALNIAKGLNGEDQSTRAAIAKAIALEHPRAAIEVSEAVAIATIAEGLVEKVGEEGCVEDNSTAIARLRTQLNTYYLGKIADAVHEFRSLDEQQIGAMCREIRTGSREVQRRIVES